MGMVGGVFRMSADVRSSFRHRVRGSVPGAVFLGPRFAPVIGSALLALKLAGVKMTSRVLGNLDAASQQVGDK